MGWEYVWHCHLLGHEENDMMREQVFQVKPETPVNLTGAARVDGYQLTFNDMSLSETGFTVERANDANFTTNVTDMTVPANAGWNSSVTFKDTTIFSGSGATFYYRVRAFKPDADYWMPLIGSSGTPTSLPNLVSPWSNSVSFVFVSGLQMSPAALNFSILSPTQTSAPQLVTLKNTGAARLSLTSMRIVGGAFPNSFSITGNTCGATLASGATCTVSIVLTPAVKGVQSASFTVVSTDPTRPTQSVALSGTVMAPLTITAGSSTINWGTTVPTITPTVTGLVAPDTLASLGTITCTTTYTATSNVGTYPTTCSGASNPNNLYVIAYVPGVLTVKPVAAAMITPAPGSVLAGSSVTFTWNTGGAAQTYALLVGTTAGSYNIYTSGWTTATSKTVTGLPLTGGTIYVRLQTIVSGVQQNVNYTYTAAGTPTPAAMVSPAPSSQLTGTSQTFTWTAGIGVSSYGLLVGTNGPGTYNLYTSGWIAGTSKTVTGLPTTGITLYVRLASMLNGVQVNTDYVYTATGVPTPATLVSPVTGSTVTGSTATFTWTPGNGVTGYALLLGTAGPGSQNLYTSGWILTTSKTVSVLPRNNTTVYVRLQSMVNGVAQSIDYVITSN